MKFTRACKAMIYGDCIILYMRPLVSCVMKLELINLHLSRRQWIHFAGNHHIAQYVLFLQKVESAADSTKPAPCVALERNTSGGTHLLLRQAPECHTAIVKIEDVPYGLLDA